MRREFIATIAPGVTRTEHDSGRSGPREIAIVAEPASGNSDGNQPRNLSPGDEHWRVTVGERIHDVRAREIRPGVWSLLCNGRAYHIDLDDRKHGTAIVHGTTEVVVQLEDARQKKLAQALSSRSTAMRGQAAVESVSAPIAGKVVKILVAVGDEVAAGQSVAVVEAMKMENDIKAERGGKVEAVHAAAGQSIDAGDKLITLA